MLERSSDSGSDALFGRRSAYGFFEPLGRLRLGIIKQTPFITGHQAVRFDRDGRARDDHSVPEQTGLDQTRVARASRRNPLQRKFGVVVVK